MKSIHILILWLFFQPVFPQKTTDQFLFRASYTFSYKTDPLQKDFVETDLIYLDIGNNSSKYYSRYTQVRDSNKIAELKKIYQQTLLNGQFLYLHYLFQIL